uniref:Uncharacterized protein isoform X2 n=1 Tax=Pogona vitticeps TaxID=103695 RepID=A0A6J0SPD4_9SAUR
MAGVDCILKLGGSALTQKDQLETLKGASLRKAAAIVAQLRGAGEKRCIVVHGAGSFGHFQAKEHDVCSGTSKESAASESLRRGLCLTRLSVTKLNHLVTEEFVSCGIPAVGISVLAMKFSPKRVIFLTDVSGIYSCPPGTAGARLVDFITVRPDGTMDPAVLTSVRPHDTTGGVSLKLQTAVNIVSHSRGAIPVLICKLDSEAAEKACLTGELKEDEGTKFSFIEA